MREGIKQIEKLLLQDEERKAHQLIDSCQCLREKN